MNVYIAVLLVAMSIWHAPPIAFQANKEHWVAGTGMMKGIEIATLVGNLNESGPFVVRLRLPAGAFWPAHYHKHRLNATVVSGELLLGFGKVADRKKMLAYPAGSFLSIPAGTPYFDGTKGATVVQEHGEGPVVSIMVAAHQP